MKKRMAIISIIIFIFLGIIVFFYNSQNENTFTQNGITYALTLNGKSTNAFPSKGMYRADVKCANATGKWLYDEWKLAIEDITSDNVSCNIDFTTISQTNLNDYIISLEGTTQGTGEVVQENGYRYEGKNPNNYIWFNNELWRIIGVFDEENHGVSGQNLVKIIKNEELGALVWDNNDSESPTKVNWASSVLMNLLNGAYLNSENGNEYCYVYYNIPGTCDYRESGINDVYRPMIENVTWYLGGYTNSSATAESFYEYERGDMVYSGSPTTTMGYIGLMYPSDYGFSALSNNCVRTTNLDSYDNELCAGQSWLGGHGSEWTITLIYDNDGNVFNLVTSGGLGGEGSLNLVHFGHSARPVLYLDSNVYVIDGDGSISDPYIIGM